MNIRFGVEVDPGLPPQSLTGPEREELAKLIHLREAASAQLTAVEQRLQLFLLTARDRRGLRGPVALDVANGTLEAE